MNSGTNYRMNYRISYLYKLNSSDDMICKITDYIYYYLQENYKDNWKVIGMVYSENPSYYQINVYLFDRPNDNKLMLKESDMLSEALLKDFNLNWAASRSKIVNGRKNEIIA